MGKHFAFLSILALVWVGVASAATPIYWTPPKMVAALKALQWPHQGILSGVCRGQSKARHGAYTGFRCTLTWQTTGAGGLESGKVAAWARPLARGRVCGSTVSLRACRPLAAGPLANDPHVCTATDKTVCVTQNSKLALRRHLGGPGGLYQGDASCQPAVGLVVSCVAGGSPYTVTWTRGISAWTAAVTP